MRYLVVCLVMIAFLLNCDGRRSKHQKFVPNSSNLSKYFEAHAPVNFIPKDMVEIKTDTIIENRFKISIRNYSTEKNPILITSQDNTSNHHYTYYRRFEAEIGVSYKDQSLIDEQLSLNQFIEEPTKAFWRNATFEHVWVNQEASTSNQLSIHVSIVNPEIKAYRLYEMKVSPNGARSIKMLKNNA